MGSFGGSPKTWIPYMNTKDCSQGFCSLYCPQWCYILVPPPPAFEFPEDNSSSSPNFNPLVIAIIGILVSAFLLVSYYAVISKYCGNEDGRRARRENHEQSEDLGDTQHSLSIHEPWHVPTAGLDEGLIKSITVCKYKRGDGLVEVTDCSVCLSEFEDDESLRLLPKCNHAFHLPCIDTWLKSHSNCPLCRANIVLTNASQLPHQPLSESPAFTNQDAASPLTESQAGDDQNVVMTPNSERGSSRNVELMQGGHAIHKASCGLGNIQEERSDSTIIEIRGDCEGYHQTIRRSFSMDEYSLSNPVLVSDILRMNDEEDEEDDDIHHVGGCSASESDDIAGSSKQSAGGVGNFSHTKGVLLHCVSPVAMKRSFSSGRFFQTRPSRSSHTVVPVQKLQILD